MPDPDPPLRPADRANLLHTLSQALRHKTRVSQQERDELVARLAAEQVLQHLEGSNYVVMQKPPARSPAFDHPVNPRLTK